MSAHVHVYEWVCVCSRVWVCVIEQQTVYWREKEKERESFPKLKIPIWNVAENHVDKQNGKSK